MTDSTGGGATSRLADVFVDRACDLATAPEIRGLRARVVDLREDVAVLDRGGVLLLGSRTTDGAHCELAVRDLRQRNPHVVIFVCAPWDKDVLHRLTTYARAGIDRLFTVEGRSDLATLMQVVSERIAAPPPQHELTVAADQVASGRPLRILRHAFRNGYRHEPLPDVAARFGCAVRTLGLYLDDAELPCPEDLFRCGRYLHDVELQRRGVRRPTERATRLGFETATAMRKWTARFRASVREEPRLAAFASRFSTLEPLRMGWEE